VAKKFAATAPPAGNDRVAGEKLGVIFVVRPAESVPWLVIAAVKVMVPAKLFTLTRLITETTELPLGMEIAPGIAETVKAGVLTNRETVVACGPAPAAPWSVPVTVMMPEAPELDTETSIVDIPEPPVIRFVPKLAETPDGVIADNRTLSEKPVMEPMVMMDEPEPPGAIVREVGAAAIVKSGLETITAADFMWLTGVLIPAPSTVTE
jgi:hypothetical protein